METVLTVIFAFIIFMTVMAKGYLAVLRPASLVILIIVSLLVGYVLAAIVVFLFGSALKVIVVIAIIAFAYFLFTK